MHRLASVLGVVLIAGCGDNWKVGDARGPDASVVAGVELPLIPGAEAFNSSAEVTIAAHGGRVVVASINFHFPNPSSFETDSTFKKRVAINVSSDGGRTYGPVGIDPHLGSGSTTDPVVRAAADGTFFVAAALGEGPAAIASSTEGLAWTPLAANVTAGDKEWFAIDDANQQLFVIGRDGYTRIGFDGSVRATFAQPIPVAQRPLAADAYVDAAGAHFAIGLLVESNKAEVDFWDGTNPPVQEVPPLDSGNDAEEMTVVTWSRGPLADGTWSVRARRENGLGSIVLRLERAGQVTESPITTPSANAFLPTAAMDRQGRLHVAYYDSSGSHGVLQYTHTRGAAPFSDGFVPPVVVDPDATPAGFYPFQDLNGEGLRRLREYIGMAIDEDVVHIAWTHSPAPPSRVHVVAIR